MRQFLKSRMFFCISLILTYEFYIYQCLQYLTFGLSRLILIGSIVQEKLHQQHRTQSKNKQIFNKQFQAEKQSDHSCVMQCQSLLNSHSLQTQSEETLEEVIQNGHDSEKGKVFISNSYINLDNSQLGSRGIALLVNIFPVIEVKQLLLWDNSIGDTGLSLLSKVKWSSLQKLRLAENNITMKGVKYLNNGNFSSVSQLSLHDNPIGNEGIKQLVKGLWKNLNSLLLSECQISNQGALLLTMGNWISLKTINLGSNSLSQMSSLALYNIKSQKNSSFTVTIFGNKFRMSISKFLKEATPQKWKICI